jgi:hypothetical protein
MAQKEQCRPQTLLCRESFIPKGTGQHHIRLQYHTNLEAGKCGLSLCNPATICEHWNVRQASDFSPIACRKFRLILWIFLQDQVCAVKADRSDKHSPRSHDRSDQGTCARPAWALRKSQCIVLGHPRIKIPSSQSSIGYFNQKF